MRLNLYEFAYQIKESLIVDCTKNGFEIYFKDADVKESKYTRICWQDRGYGSTVDRAAENYFIKINKKRLVFTGPGGWGKNRREYNVVLTSEDE